MSDKQDPYTVLGISPDASMDVIKHAYRRLAFQYHPDLHQTNVNTTVTMQMINEAYAIISDPVRRKELDLLMRRPAVIAKYSRGIAVIISSSSSSPYRNHVGVIDKEPVKDTFRFWYMIKIQGKGYSTVIRVPEEEVSAI